MSNMKNLICQINRKVTFWCYFLMSDFIMFHLEFFIYYY